MSKKDTSLDDIGQAVTDLGSMISQQIESTKTGLEQQIESTKTEILGELFSFKTETNTRFDKIEGTLTAIENDVKDMYKMLADVQKAVGKLRKNDKELDRRLTNLEEFAKNLSRQTGVPFET